MDGKEESLGRSQMRREAPFGEPSSSKSKPDKLKSNKGKAKTNFQDGSDDAATETDVAAEKLDDANPVTKSLSHLSLPFDHDSGEAESSERQSQYYQVYEFSAYDLHDQGPAEVPRPASGTAYEHKYAHARNPKVDNAGYHPQDQVSGSGEYVYEARELDYRREIDRVDDHRFWQPQRPHGFRRSMNTPSLESSFPNLRANQLGELQYGLRYVCEEFRPKWSESKELFLPASLCAYYLGYNNVFSMADEKELSILSLKNGEFVNWKRLYLDREERDWVVSALAMFRTFGRLVVRDPEAHALDYSLMDSHMGDYDGTKEYRPPKLESTRLDKVLPPSDEVKRLRMKFLKDSRAAEQQLEEYLEGLTMLVERPLQLLGHINDLAEILDLIPPDLMEKVSPYAREVCKTSSDRASRTGTSGSLSNNQHFRLLVSQWELPSVIGEYGFKREGAVRSWLAQHLVVIGSKGKYKCSSCLELVEGYWGSSGDTAVSLLSEALTRARGNSFFHGSRSFPTLGSSSVTYAGTQSVLAVAVATEGDEIPFLEAICWICSALRKTTEANHRGNPFGPALSQALKYTLCQSRRRTPIQPRRYDFRKLKRLQHVDTEFLSEFCWTKLFKCAVAVESVLDRSWGRGLEIPFALMIELAAVENICTLNGQTALLGFHTILLPTAREDSTERVQWHFFSVDPKKGPLLPTHLESLLEVGSLKLDVETLKTTTCFLGWVNNANIMLGTEELVERREKMQSCRTLDPGITHLERDQVQGAVQVSFTMPIMSLNLQGGGVWKVTDDITERTRSSEYRQALNQARRKTCLLIDSHSKQAWYVPLLSVLFHLCHRYHQINKPPGSDERTPIPYIEPTPLADDAVIDAISQTPNLEVSGVHLSAIFHMLYLNVVHYPRHNCAEYVYANDLMDAVESARTYPRKVPLNDHRYSWPDLLPFANAADAVAVCTNIGPVLQVPPGSGNPACLCKDSLCNQLPEGRSYCAVHMSSLRHLWNPEEEYLGTERPGHEPSFRWNPRKPALTRRRYRISWFGAFWIPRTDPWRSWRCNGTSLWSKKETAVAVLQRTSLGSWGKWFDLNKLKPMESKESKKECPPCGVLSNIPKDGALVFGRY